MSVTISSLPKVKNPYVHKVHPEWGPNTGRNTNSGKFTGTFVGWFDQLVISFGYHTMTEHTQILTSLGVATASIVFFDTVKNTTKTEDFYLDSIETEVSNYKKGLCSPMTITMTAIARRSDM